MLEDLQDKIHQVFTRTTNMLNSVEKIGFAVACCVTKEFGGFSFAAFKNVAKNCFTCSHPMN